MIKKHEQDNRDTLSRKSVRQALRSWYELPKLGELPLARLKVVEKERLASKRAATAAGYGLSLRELLQRALNQLKAERGEPNYEDKRWYAYIILKEEFIEGRSANYLSVQLNNMALRTYQLAQAKAIDKLMSILHQWEDEDALRLGIHLSPQPEQSPITSQERHDSAVRKLAISPNGRQLVSADSHGTLYLWDLETFKSQKILEKPASIISDVAYSPTGSQIVIAASGELFIWDVASAEITCHISHPSAMALTMHPQKPLVATGGAEGQIRLWNLPEGTLLDTLSAHRKAVTSLSFSPDGNWLASGSADGTVGWWKV